MELRPYQLECVSQIVQQFKELSAFLCSYSPEEIAASEVLQRRLKRLQKALVVLPTAAGKTIIFCSADIEIRHFIEEQAGQGLNSLILAHREELLKQAAEKYRLLRPDMQIGQVGAGRYEWGAPITVASVSTLARPAHLKQLKYFGFQFVVIDEAHHTPARGYQDIIAALPYSFFLYVTATPDRLDNKPVLEHPPLFNRSILDMIPQGYLCNLKAIAIRTQTSLEHIGRSMGDYNEGELAEVVDNERRNRRIVDAYLEHAEGRQFLCFCVNIQHAEHVAAAFQASFVPVALITGKTPPDLRARYLSDYQAGRLSGLVNVNVLTEGTDLPCTSCIILARPTQSRALFVQALGRGLRLADGKENCVLLDITDNVLTHRLEPMNLSTALNRRIGNNESLLEMLEREEREVCRRREAAEREEQERIIRQKQRQQDLVLDLLRHFHWQQNEAGYYILEVGPLKHRIAVIPDRTNPDLWCVGAKLAPLYKFQLWQSDPMPLDWALSYADREATRLLAESTYHYRPSNLATPKQIARLDKWRFEYPKDSNGNCLLTKEEASSIIEEKIQEFEERRKKREEQIVYL